MDKSPEPPSSINIPCSSVSTPLSVCALSSFYLTAVEKTKMCQPLSFSTGSGCLVLFHFLKQVILESREFARKASHDSKLGLGEPSKLQAVGQNPKPLIFFSQDQFTMEERKHAGKAVIKLSNRLRDLITECFIIIIITFTGNLFHFEEKSSWILHLHRGK